MTLQPKGCRLEYYFGAGSRDPLQSAAAAPIGKPQGCGRANQRRRQARPHPRILESPGTQANGRVAAPCLGILPGFAADARFGTKANALTCRRMPQRAMRPAPVGRNGVGRIFGGTAPAAETLV